MEHSHFISNCAVVRPRQISGSYENPITASYPTTNTFAIPVARHQAQGGRNAVLASPIKARRDPRSPGRPSSTREGFPAALISGYDPPRRWVGCHFRQGNGDGGGLWPMKVASTSPPAHFSFVSSILIVWNLVHVPLYPPIMTTPVNLVIDTSLSLLLSHPPHYLVFVHTWHLISGVFSSICYVKLCIPFVSDIAAHQTVHCSSVCMYPIDYCVTGQARLW